MNTTTSDETQITPRRARRLYSDLSVQILLAMVLGGLTGYLWPQSADATKPLGDLFIKLVRMLVAPIIFCTVVHGIASVREAKRVGRVAIKALIYFEIVTTLALVIALVLVNAWAPGANMHVDPASLSDKSVASVEASAQHANFAEFLLDIVPSSAVGAFADGEVLQVMFISILFAFALSAIGAKAAPVVEAIGTASQILFKMIGYVMVVAPIAAFGAIAYTVGKFGPSTLFALGQLIVEFYICCAVFMVLVLWPIAHWTGLSFIRLIRY